MMRRPVTLLVALAVTAAPAAVVSSAFAAPTPAAVETVTLNRGEQHIYRGTGNRSFGTLNLKRTARLSWRHPRGGLFRLFTRGARGLQFPLVTTRATTGSVRLRAGTYRGLRVQTQGGWRITITTLK